MSTSPPSLRLLHDVWREVSRHLEIGDAVPDLHALIAMHMPVHTLWVRRWLPSRGRLETVALAGSSVSDDANARRTQVDAAAAGQLRAWATRRRMSLYAGPAGGLAAVLAPPGVTGPFAAGPLLERGELAGVVVLSGRLTDHIEALDALLEPFATALQNDHRMRELAAAGEAAVADRSALLTRLARQDISDTIVGEQQGLREVMAQVVQVARTDAPVLLLGETGSGKEVVARAIHDRSPRNHGPFLRVNCGAIAPELVDSELFGHEKGAFTGAVATRKGWFERATEGTLFLDEIGELPPAAQVRLLRVLQDGTFQRVGGVQTLTCDVRIVAATHRDLKQHVRDGRFREDLWYRVHVFPIALPPLRHRQADIPMLVDHFATRAGQRLFGRPLFASPSDLAALKGYAWPGNVRELAAVIERAAILGDGRGLAVRAALGAQPAAAVVAPELASESAIHAALAQSRGRIEGPFGAAAHLGVNPHTLRARMRKLGIDWARYRAQVGD